jgi:hypothetical protein
MPNKHIIDLTKAAEMTERYRRNVPKDGDGVYVLKLGGSFDKDAINQLTAQTKFDGLRYYFALNDKKEMTVVLVAIDSNGNDIIGTGAIILDHASLCPFDCGTSNVLNT